MWVCAYPVFYDNWPMKCENNGSLLQGKPVYRRVVLKSIWLPQFPTFCTLLNTVDSHCLLYIPNFQNISKCHGRIGFADDFVQWCGERYEIEIKHTLPCHHTDTHTHTQMCAQTHFKLMCEHWLCRAELPHGKSLQHPILGTWHYCCWNIISLTKEIGN